MSDTDDDSSHLLIDDDLYLDFTSYKFLLMSFVFSTKKEKDPCRLVDCSMLECYCYC